MPSVTLPIGADGPTLDLGVAVSSPRQVAMRQAGLAIPPPVVIRGLIDTGASCTCIDMSVISALQLQQTGTVPIHTPSTGSSPHVCPQYDILLASFMENNQVHLLSLVIPVIGVDFSNHTYKALVGRDVLARGMLVYNGGAQTFTLTV
jgi:hypothetical protein